MKKVLITGAGGFIGSALMRHFSCRGYRVLGWSRSAAVRDGVCMERVDMYDPQAVQKSLEAYRPDIIIHCAGSADVSRSVADPQTDFQCNVTVTHVLLFALHFLKREDARVVFLSSAAVYGNPSVLPVTEDAPPEPLSPYALHKIMCEDMCGYFIRNYGMDIKIVRIFSAYGAGLRKQIFWDMYCRFQKTGRLDLYGTGEESRDYIHIQDVVQAIFLVAVKPSEDRVFNVANGEETTIRQAAELFGRIAGVEGAVSFNGNRREGEPVNWRADIRRLRELGYRKTTDMENGLSEYVRRLKNAPYTDTGK